MLFAKVGQEKGMNMTKSKILLSLFLTATLLTTTTLNSFANIQADDCDVSLPAVPKDASIKTVSDGNGCNYYIKSFLEGDATKVVITSDLNTDVVILTNDNMEELTVEKYILEDSNAASTSLDDDYSVVEDQYLLDESVDQSDAFASLTYGNSIYDTYRGKYYYAWGKSSYGNTYLKVGNVAAYNLKYWSLSTSQQSRCNAYTQEIKDVRAHIYNAIFALRGESATVYAILGVVLVFAVTVPPAAIELAVGTALGITGFAVKQVLDARADYIDAAELYSIIKTYPQ